MIHNRIPPILLSCLNSLPIFWLLRMRLLQEIVGEGGQAAIFSEGA